MAQPPAPPQADPELEMKKESHAFDMEKKKEDLAFQKQKNAAQLEMDFASNNAKLATEAAKVGIDPQTAMQFSPKAQQQSAQQMNDMLAVIENVARMASAPKRVVRDMDGKVVGIEPATMN
jgi:hypothetical protein